MNKAEIAALDKRHVWHPFTQMRDWENDTPIFIDHGKGAKLYDWDGNEYWDANSSLWVNIHGHARPEIDAAITQQLAKCAHSTMLGLAHPLEAILAEQLCQVAPNGLNRVFYSDSGSTAVEIAVKMAYQYHRHVGHPERNKFIALEESYHGDTIGSVSVGGIGLFHGIFRRLLFPVDFVPNPSRQADAKSAANKLDEILLRSGPETAAVIVEPLIQGAAGMLLSPRGFLTEVRALCDRYGVLLIVDEVATGFGRTGKMFACEHEGVSPDLMCVAKGITGGYLPLAATLTTDKIYEAFLGDYSELKTFFHGHSYTGNPLACAAALASLEIFEKDDVIHQLASKIDFIATRLKDIGNRTHVGSIRQCGMMVGIELFESPGIPYPFEQAIGSKVCRRARELGLITRPLGNVIVFMPPLVSTVEELGSMLDIIERSIADATETIA